MKRYQAISAVLMVMFLISTGPAQSTSILPVTFYGYVFSSDLVAPIEGAIVTAWTSDALGTTAIGYTNWHGYYEGNGEVPPGWYWLQATTKSQKSRIECAYYDGCHSVRIDFHVEQ